jgi:hypothetical protein
MQMIILIAWSSPFAHVRLASETLRALTISSLLIPDIK